MTLTDSPAAARRRVRLAVRRAREEKGLTQGEVADRLEWSISKVNRIENGEVSVSATDLKALIGLLDITDAPTIEALLQDARVARKRGWWHDPSYRGHVTPTTLQLVQYEAEATAIRTFQPTLIPGVMQTPEYTASVLEFWSAELPPDARKARQALRAHRGRQLFEEPGSPTYLVLLDESVVIREVGGPTTLANQLQAVLALMKKAPVTLRIVPLANSAPISSLGGFTLFDLPSVENAIMYREIALGDQIIENADVLSWYRGVYEHAWELALTPMESIQLIEARAAELAWPSRAR